MIPTLFGRWQSRLLIFVIFGLPVTYIYGIALAGWSLLPAREPFLLLVTILGLGLILDCVYSQMQRFRWDNDWPFAFFVFFSYAEFLLVVGAMRLDWLPWLPSCRQTRTDPLTRQLVCQIYTIPFWLAFWHFTSIFVPAFVFVVGLGQTLLLRWRFKGGELGRLPINDA